MIELTMVPPGVFKQTHMQKQITQASLAQTWVGLNIPAWHMEVMIETMRLSHRLGWASEPCMCTLKCIQLSHRHQRNQHKPQQKVLYLHCKSKPLDEGLAFMSGTYNL